MRSKLSAWVLAIGATGLSAAMLVAHVSAGGQAPSSQRSAARVASPTAPDHWVETWTSAQQTQRTAPGVSPPAPFVNQTIRMIAHTSIGGKRLRVEFANTYGTAPLVVGAAHLGLRANDSAVTGGSDRVLRVNGKGLFTIPPGGLMVTDPVDLNVPPLSDLAVSVYIPGKAERQTQHSLGLHTTYISKEGDFTNAPSMTDSSTSLSWYWLASIQVMAPSTTGSVIAFGDSITDGFHSTADTNRMWPAVLSQRLLASSSKLSIVNEAISGNQILRDGLGVNALARFDHDVIARAGARWLVILEGINDIGRGLGPAATPETAVSADDLIAADRQMIERAHTHGMKVIGATLTPYEGAGYYSEAGEAARVALNSWIRTGGAFDAVVDFDKATRDPSHPARFLPEYDSGDHLHPNDVGYQAMADAVDLTIFSAKAW